MQINMVITVLMSRNQAHLLVLLTPALTLWSTGMKKKCSTCGFNKLGLHTVISSSLGMKTFFDFISPIMPCKISEFLCLDAPVDLKYLDKKPNSEATFIIDTPPHSYTELMIYAALILKQYSTFDHFTIILL